jgi:rubrerythrin
MTMSDDTKPSTTTSQPVPGGQRGASMSWLDLSCCACGYGVHVRSAPVQCPMCRGAAWQVIPSRGGGIQDL